MAALSLIWDLIARDQASPAFLRVAGSADKAAASTARATKSIGGSAAAMGRVGAKLTKGLTLPLLGLGAVAVDQAAKFQASMERIRTQAGGTQKDVAVLSKQILAMKGSQFGPQALAQSMYHLKSVGLDNADAMKALTQSTHLAAVGGADLESTTNALAGAWRTGIRGATNFHQAVSTVNAIIGAGNMTLEDFTAALGTGILPTAKTFGLTLKDVGSALALFTDEGVPADAAATRLRMSMSLLGAPSKAAEKQLANIGLTGLKLADDMRKPNGLIRAIGDLKSHLEDPKFKLSLSEQSQLLSHAFGGGRSSSAILSLINNFDVLKKKQDQVTGSMGKFDSAVTAQKHTLAARWDTLKASLGNLGVKIGTALLPVAERLVADLQQLVHWFQNLSGTDKTIAKWSVGILFALGPVLSIGAKLAVVGRGMMATATLFTTAGSRVALAMRGITAALGGAAIGYAVGTLTKNSSTAVKAIGVLGSAAAGAALGSAGGPIGAVIGGIAGGVSALATQYLSAGDDAKKGGGLARLALQEQKKAADELLGSLQAVDGAYKHQYKTQVAQQLQQKGALDLAAKLHVSGRDVVQASLGSPEARTRVRSQIGSFLAAGHEDQVGAAGKLFRILGITEIAAKHAENEYTLLVKATGKGIVPTKQLANGTKELGKELKGTGTTLNEATAYGARNTEVIRENIGYLRRQAEQQYKNGKSAGAVAKGFDRSTSSLKKFLHGMGFKTPDLDALFKKLAHPPKLPAIRPKVDTSPAGVQITKLQARIDAMKQGNVPGVDVYTAEGHFKLAQLQLQLDRLRSKSITVGVNTVFHGAGGGSTLPQNARGGGLPEGVSTVGERGFEVAIKSGRHVQILSNIASRKFLSSTGIRAPGFAGGTPGVHMPSPRVPSSVGRSGSHGGVQRMTLDVPGVGTLTGYIERTARDVVIDESDFDGTIGRMR